MMIKTKIKNVDEDDDDDKIKTTCTYIYRHTQIKMKKGQIFETNEKQENKTEFRIHERKKRILIIESNYIYNSIIQ